MVFPNIYHRYEAYGDNPIVSKEDVSSLSEEDKAILKNIWTAFKSCSSIVPWTKIYKSMHQFRSKIISHIEGQIIGLLVYFLYNNIEKLSDSWNLNLPMWIVIPIGEVIAYFILKFKKSKIDRDNISKFSET
jgi:hypothetical protein